MTPLHLSATYCFYPDHPSGVLDGSRAVPARPVHLLVMDTQNQTEAPTDRSQLTLIGQIISLSDLCAHLHVSAQTIYDLRSQGRGPRGFRVGRELRFRASEIEAWLERMEQDDGPRHVPGRS